MKKRFAITLAFVSALSVSGCYTPQQQTGTLAGGAIGAGGGALIGSALTGGSAGGAIAAHYRRWDRRAHRQRGDRATQALRAVGLRLQRQPLLPRLVLISSHFTRHRYSCRYRAVSSVRAMAPPERI